MPDDQQPKKTPESIIKSLESKASEARLKKFEEGAAAIIKERDTAAQTVRLKTAELNEYVRKFKDDLI